MHTKLISLTPDQLICAFAAIPNSVTHLDLKQNRLGKKTCAELAEAFAAIPLSVKYIEINDVSDSVLKGMPHPAFQLQQATQLLLESKATTEPSGTEDLACAGAGSAPGAPTETNYLEKLQAAIELLLQIPEEAAVYKEACTLLWPELYGIYTEQQKDKLMSTTPMADVACSEETGGKDLTLKDIMNYAMGAGELGKLFVNRHPDVAVEPGYKVDTMEKFEFAEKYLKENKDPADRLAIGSPEYIALQYCMAPCVASYGF